MSDMKPDDKTEVRVHYSSVTCVKWSREQPSVVLISHSEGCCERRNHILQIHKAFLLLFTFQEKAAELSTLLGQ